MEKAAFLKICLKNLDFPVPFLSSRILDALTGRKFPEKPKLFLRKLWSWGVTLLSHACGKLFLNVDFAMCGIFFGSSSIYI
jgi:hypothetical protein